MKKPIKHLSVSKDYNLSDYAVLTYCNRYVNPGFAYKRRRDVTCKQCLSKTYKDIKRLNYV